MTACTHRLWGEPDGLACIRTDPHQSGHQYQSGAGSDLGEGQNHAKEPME